MKQIPFPFTAKDRRVIRRIKGENLRGWTVWSKLKPRKKLQVEASDSGQAKALANETLKAKFTDLRVKREVEK